MPDARLLVGIAALGGLLLLGLVIFIVERRHAARNRRREPARLPLFGTEQLAIRTTDGYEEGGPETASEPSVRPTAASPSARPVPPRHEPPRTAPSRSEPPLIDPPGRSMRASGPAAPAAAAQSPVRPGDFAPRTSTPRPATPVASAMATQQYTAPGPRPGTAKNGVAAADPVAASTGVPSVDAAMIDGETLRFALPIDGTVEFLPGHLEVVAGPDSGKEIRFVRAPGDTKVEVTFGRSEGPAHRHIQILARTVSRRHAVMSLIDDHWELTNLSSTNPLILNGRVLAGDEVAPLLVEGDRIEMGEVVFVYHDA